MRILVCDGVETRAKRLAEKLALRGHVVDQAANGAAGLELALDAVPQLVICPIDLPVIEGGRLGEILRSNPRTRAIQMIFLVEDELDAPVAMDVRDRVVAAPWDDEAVLAQLDEMLDRESGGPLRPERTEESVAQETPEAATPEAEAVAAPEPTHEPAALEAEAVAAPEPTHEPAREAAQAPQPPAAAVDTARPAAALSPSEETEPTAAPGPASASGQAGGEVQGDLAQMSLTDLLQVFHINQKTGTVRISRGRGAESIQLVEGQVVDAKMPLADGSSIRGEKALFRLLAATEGRFEFVPGEPQREQSIVRPTRALLLEAVRQSDEWERYLTDLPAPDARLCLVVGRDDVNPRAHPLTAAVLQTLSAYPRVGDLVDHCPFPDYQVLRAIGDLLSRRMLQVMALAPLPVEPAHPPVDDRTFDATQVRRIREWRAAQGSGSGPIVKVLLIPADREVLDQFAAMLPDCPDYEPVGPGGMGSTGARRAPAVGPLGHFPLGERQKLRLVAVSPDPVLEPLWSVAAYGALGAIVLLRGQARSGLAEAGPLVASLRRWAERPVAYAVLTEGEEATLEDLVLGEIPEDPGAGVFALPGKATPERRAILRRLLARLAP